MNESLALTESARLPRTLDWDWIERPTAIGFASLIATKQRSVDLVRWWGRSTVFTTWLNCTSETFLYGFLLDGRNPAEIHASETELQRLVPNSGVLPWAATMTSEWAGPGRARIVDRGPIAQAGTTSAELQISGSGRQPV